MFDEYESFEMGSDAWAEAFESMFAEMETSAAAWDGLQELATPSAEMFSAEEEDRLDEMLDALEEEEDREEGDEDEGEYEGPLGPSNMNIFDLFDLMKEEEEYGGSY